jgi:predicted metalloprotease
LAHEFAHIYTLSANKTFFNTVNTELFADFMAGAYLYYSQRDAGFITNTIVIDFTTTGSNSFTNRRWHGDVSDRNLAISRGYNFYRIKAQNSNFVSLSDVALEGYRLYP